MNRLHVFEGLLVALTAVAVGAVIGNNDTLFAVSFTGLCGLVVGAWTALP